MQHITITPKLFLVEHPVPKAAASPPRPENINHIWEIDRSGSMSSLLPKLVQDLRTKVRDLPLGDTLTLGWFSGEGQRNFVLKGFKLNDKQDYTTLDKAFASLERSMGTTCFSEILIDTDQVLEDLKVISPNFAFILFTDGYPVVSNYSREVERIHTALSNIKGKLTASLLVGYGDYYNKELMAQMAEKVGGALIHSSDLPTFSVAFSSFVEDARESSGDRVVMDVGSKWDSNTVFFGINGKQINLLQPNDKNEISFPVSKKAKDFLYVLTNTLPSGSREVTLSDAALRGKSAGAESAVKGAYAAAYILTQKTKTDLALEVLGKLGDKAMVDAVTNAFTNAEYGAAEGKLAKAMAAPSKRLENGRDTKYLPPRDAFCLLDALDILETASFFPGHDAFEYKRTGRATEVKEGYAKFVYNDDASTPLNLFTWNSSRLNLSVLAKIDGTIDLLDKDGVTAKKLGLQQQYPTFIFRNFMIVKDGTLHSTKLPVTIPKEGFDKLQAKGLIEQDVKWKQDEIVVVHLDRVPIVNRAIADGKTSAKDLAINTFRELELKGIIKTLKYYRDELPEALPVQTGKLTLGEKQQAFLLANGIQEKGDFSPPSTKSEIEDYYMARSFEIKVKGCSSLPAVAKVIEKFNAGKALTLSESLVYEGAKVFTASGMEGQFKEVVETWLDKKIAELQGKMRGIRRNIQETKFAVILGKQWFSEFTTRDNPTLAVDANTFTFELGEEKVAY